MPIYKIQAGRIITVESDTYIGAKGTIFYDEELGDLRLSDGVTPGGRPLELGGSGTSISITGSVASSDLLDADYTGAAGAGFIAEDTGDLWVRTSDSWTNVGKVQGPTGYTGSQGAIGYAGSSGRSAYEVATDNGFSGSEQEWINSLGQSQSLTAESNAGLSISSGTIATVYNSQISDDVQSIAVGGAASLAASEWKSKNIVEVLDTILFPDVAPTYTIPTLSISASQSGTKEIGSSISQSLSLSSVKNDAGEFTLLTLSRSSTSIASTSNPTGSSASEIVSQFGYASPNNPNFSYSLAASDPVTVINGTITWSGNGTYSAGQPKKNNKGVSDNRSAAVRNANAPQAASSITSNSVTVTGIYPYFWGKSSTPPTTSSIATAIAEGTANKVLSAANSTLTVTYNAVAEYVWVAHVSSYTTKTKWYNTELNQGDIGAGNFILAPVTQTVNSPDEFWSNVSFKIYISDGATNTSGALQFRNS